MALSYPFDNVILAVDCYKLSHHKQYPPKTTILYSYFESRGGKFSYTVFFGLQYILKRWMVGPVITKEKIKEAKEFYTENFEGSEEHFNEEGWTHILTAHKGHLPLRIKAVPEGSVIPTKNVLFTVENTDPKVAWLTNWFETLLVQTWYPITVATKSRVFKELLTQSYVETSDNVSQVPFFMLEVGCRAATSMESASIAGAANLVNFRITDTVPGYLLLKKYYHYKKIKTEFIAAGEHSTQTTWGKEGEVDSFRHCLKEFSGNYVAISDSYDIFGCCENIWGKELKNEVIEKGKKGKMVIVRPDSGDPLQVLLKCLEILGKAFGTTVNSKGYKLLPPYLKICQGDHTTLEVLQEILQGLKKHGWCVDNVFFGSGGSLIQEVNRDTQKCAFKCSYSIIDNKGVNVFKKPITDPGKNSKKGYLTLQKEGNKYLTTQEGQGNSKKDFLVTVFENGTLLKDYTLEEIRQNAELDVLKQ